MAQSHSEGWRVVEVTGIGVGELWFDAVSDGLSKTRAERKARNEARWIAIPEQSDRPEDWGEQWLNGELEVDDYAEVEA